MKKDRQGPCPLGGRHNRAHGLGCGAASPGGWGDRRAASPSSGGGNQGRPPGGGDVYTEIKGEQRSEPRKRGWGERASG